MYNGEHAGNTIIRTEPLTTKAATWLHIPATESVFSCGTSLIDFLISVSKGRNGRGESELAVSI